MSESSTEIKASHYVKYDSTTGQILMAGFSYFPEKLILDPSVEKLLICESAVDSNNKYVNGSGVLVDKGESPGPQFIFNYQTKQWEDPRTLQFFKDAAYKKIEEWRNKQENQTFQFIHAGRQWDAGLITRQRMQPVLGLSQLPEGFFWTDAANNDVPMNIESLRQLDAAHEQALVLRGFQIHARQRTMKGSLETMTRQQLLDFDPGWTDPVLIPDPAQAG